MCPWNHHQRRCHLWHRVWEDEPQDSTKHEPKHCTLFQGVDPCVAGTQGKERVSESFLPLGCHQECGQFAIEDQTSETYSTQSCHRECDPSATKSVNWGASNSDGVQIQMTAESETERLDDVGVTEWLDDVGLIGALVNGVAHGKCQTPEHTCTTHAALRLQIIV